MVAKVKRTSSSRRAKQTIRRGKVLQPVKSSTANGMDWSKSAPVPAKPREVEAVSPTAERDRPAYEGDSAIKLYLREIGQVQLLTPQEEIELAARIKKGDK